MNHVSRDVLNIEIGNIIRLPFSFPVGRIYRLDFAAMLERTVECANLIDDCITAVAADNDVTSLARARRLSCSPALGKILVSFRERNILLGRHAVHISTVNKFE